jgi:ATP-binding cassette subfamily C protein
VVIAHRMSSALRARRVLVLDGDRSDIGTHDSLLSRGPHKWASSSIGDGI